MKILFTAAVEPELDAAKQAYDSFLNIETESIEVDFALTGIGTTSTTYALTKTILGKDYDLIINIGIAGTYSDKLSLGVVTRVVEEQFGDVGMETKNGFQTLFDYEILDANTYPFIDGVLYAKKQSVKLENYLSKLPQVSSITVQTISGLEERFLQIKEKFGSQIESMEGAAFFYTCLMEKRNFIEIRAISNMVGERDITKWEVEKSLKNLRDVCLDLLINLES